jgi:uncharacterized protein
MRPVSSAERNVTLDALRGAALLGVLMVNLLVGFRISLFEHIFTFHTHPGWTNHAVDILVSWLFEFKAFTLFSFMFGVGVGVQAERAALHKNNGSIFFARRFAVLLAIGLFHMLLIWNGDILTLYAVCGLLLIPLIERRAGLLALIGITFVVLSPHLPIFWALFPTEAAMRAHAVVATRIYATGSFTEILALRFNEAWRYIAPFVFSSLPRTLGLMLIGIAAWRSGVFKRPEQRRKYLLAILIVAGTIGAVATTLLVRSESTGVRPPIAPELLNQISAVPLALSYGAGLLLWLSETPGGLPRRLFAAAGQMALSNYLAQSVIFSVIFYGFGLGLFGRLGSAITALIGITVFVGQLFASHVWLRRYRFGPAEWLWRSLTYGRWQPMRQATDAPKLSGLFKCVGDLQHLELFSEAPDDLQSDRQSIGRKTARH